MTACSHLLCVKHGASISSCPVCHADVPATHLSSLDFGHQLSSREVSLLRSIAIKAPREISQLLVEANSFVLKQANFQFGSLHDRKETESASLDQTNQALIQKNGALRQQLSEVSREAETSAVVLAELREDLRRVEQQQCRAGGFGSGNWNSSGTSSVGGEKVDSSGATSNHHAESFSSGSSSKEGNHVEKENNSTTTTKMEELSMFDVVFGQTLGVGSFGVVKQAYKIIRGKSRSDWPMYAIKQMDLSHYDLAKREERVMLDMLLERGGGSTEEEEDRRRDKEGRRERRQPPSAPR